MENKAFVEKLTAIAGQKTVYNNKFPYNCGYISKGVKSFDCYNYIKTILNGMDVNKNTEGYFFPPAEMKVTGDISGAQMIAACSKRGKDFSKLVFPGTLLYLSNPSGHTGIYIGEIKIKGKTYNTLEATKNSTFGINGVGYTYVDEKGYRRAYKDGPKSCRWEQYGEMPWVEYTWLYKFEVRDVPEVADGTKNTITKNTKGDEALLLQQDLNYLGYVDSNGYNLDEDGIIGDLSISALRAFQAANNLVVDGKYGPKSTEKMRELLNR